MDSLPGSQKAYEARTRQGTFLQKLVLQPGYREIVWIAVAVHFIGRFAWLFWETARNYTLLLLCPALILVQTDEKPEPASIAGGKDQSSEATVASNSGGLDQDRGLRARQTWVRDEGGSDSASCPLSSTTADHHIEHATTSSLPKPQEAPITSISGLLKRLYMRRGIRGLRQGFWLASLAETVVVALSFLFVDLLHINEDLSCIIIALLSIPLTAAQVHYTLSTKSRGSIWAWFPPFKRTFQATWRLHLLEAIALIAKSHAIKSLQEPFWVTDSQETPPFLFGRNFGKWSEILSSMTTWDASKHALAIFIRFSIIYGQEVLFTAVMWRVHASMLPSEEETVVPVQKAFGFSAAKKRGYLTITEAWQSLTWPTWIRLGSYYVKVLVINSILFATGAILWILSAQVLGREEMEMGAAIIDDSFPSNLG